MSNRFRSELPHLLLLAAMFLTAALGWSSAPERVPVHWNLHGEADRWGGKVEGLLVMPLASLGVYLLLLFLPRLDPGLANYRQFGRPYAILRFAILAFLTLLYGVIQLNVHNYPVPIERVMPFGLGLLFAVMGAVLGKIRPNWLVGIRTPWTLSSKEAWVKTHRLGGWLFLGLGVATVVASLLHPTVAIVTAIAGAVATTVVCLVYSYRVWKTDPDKIAPVGTLPADDQ